MSVSVTNPICICYHATRHRLQYCQYCKLTSFCIPKTRSRAKSFHLITNQIDKNSWFYMRFWREARGMVRDNDHLGNGPAILQLLPEIIAFQAPFFDSVQGLLSFLDSTMVPLFFITLKNPGSSFRPNTTHLDQQSSTPILCSTFLISICTSVLYLPRWLTTVMYVIVT